MAVKYNAHFLHNDGAECLDNLSYSEKFIKMLFWRCSGDCSVFLSAVSNSKLPKHGKCVCVIMTAD